MTKAYAQGLIHRLVFVVVENPQGQILLQKRSLAMLNYPGCWDVSVGGHVDAGEDYKTAATRELGEELGLRDFDLTEIKSFYHAETLDNRNLKRFIKVYKLVIPVNTTLTPDAHEVTATQWLDVKAIKTLIANHPEDVASGLKLCMASY